MLHHDIVRPKSPQTHVRLMTQLENLKHGHLKNAQHCSFHCTVVQNLQKIEAKYLPDIPRLANYIEWVAREKWQPTPLSTRHYAEQLQELRHQRQQHYRGLHHALQSHLNGFDADKHEAARLFLHAITYAGYRNKRRGELDESIMMILMVKHAREKLADHMSQLQLEPWMDHIDQMNQEIEQVKDLREQQRLNYRPQYTTQQLRHEVDEGYRQVRNYLHALMLLNGPEPYEHAVRCINTEIDRLKLIMAQRKGRARKKREKLEQQAHQNVSVKASIDIAEGEHESMN